MPIDMAKYMRERRLKRRQDLIDLAGGKCLKCGAGNVLTEWNFDHRDPTIKSFDLSGCALDKAWTKIMAEYAKCDLLCAPCHRIKTVLNGEIGYHRTIDDCGTEAVYMKGCRCEPCRKARHDARVARGEIKGVRRNRSKAMMA